MGPSTVRPLPVVAATPTPDVDVGQYARLPLKENDLWVFSANELHHQYVRSKQQAPLQRATSTT